MYVIVGNFFNRPLKFTESLFSNLIVDISSDFCLLYSWNSLVSFEKYP